MIASGFGGVIVNITNPCDVITQIIQQTSGFPDAQVFGTGTSLDTARMKRVVGEFLALIRKVSPVMWWANTENHSLWPGVPSPSADARWLNWQATVTSTG